jgi:hypothetical protein
MTEQTTTAHINIEKVEQMAAYYEAPAGFFDWLDLMKDLNSTHNPQSREDDEREAFEAWYASGWKHNGFQRTHCGGGYLIAAVEQAWQGWKARAYILEDTHIGALMRDHRIAVTPEHEGGWHADLYGTEAEPLAKAEGVTPEQAVLRVIAAYQSGSPEGLNQPQQGGDQ